ncbi:MAG TPA: hypothetical protein VF845_08460, partial [Terriglobales bacterium]
GFVTHPADWAEKDRNALLCQLNSYMSSGPLLRAEGFRRKRIWKNSSAVAIPRWVVLGDRDTEQGS